MNYQIAGLDACFGKDDDEIARDAYITTDFVASQNNSVNHDDGRMNMQDSFEGGFPVGSGPADRTRITKMKGNIKKAALAVQSKNTTNSGTAFFSGSSLMDSVSKHFTEHYDSSSYQQSTSIRPRVSKKKILKGGHHSNSKSKLNSINEKESVYTGTGSLKLTIEDSILSGY